MKKEKTFLLYLTPQEHKEIKLRSVTIGISINQYIYEAICDRFEKENHLGWPNTFKQQEEQNE